MNDRPDIVLMVSDDHGREAMGCYGNQAVQTPHLDALAADGVRFDNAFCSSASCSPSRSTILSGKHGHATGVYGLTHNEHHFACFDGLQTLSALLGEAGYRTGRVGKKHYRPENLFPFDWDLYEPLSGSRDDVRMSESCREFVRGKDPFFLYWCSYNPHRRSTIEDHPLKIDDFGNPPEPFTGDEERPFSPDEVEVPFWLSDTPETRSELAQYYQSIARLDRGVGRLLQVLREEGRYENTLIIYLSDNGAAFPGAKTTLYDPGIKLPCLLRSPRHSERGVSSRALISWADIMPTILDFAGLSAPLDIHGASFKDIIGKADPSAGRQEVYASHSLHGISNYYPMRAVITSRHKFIWNIAWKLNYSFASDLWQSAVWQGQMRHGLTHLGSRPIEQYIHRSRFELYDREADPQELDNLADRPEYAVMVADFSAKLRRFQEKTGDPWLHKWEYE